MRRVLLFLIVLLSLALPRSVAAQDHAYVQGQIIEVNAEIALRSAPSYAGDVVATLSPGDRLTVLDGASVHADALYWVHVSFSEESVTGWVPDIAISGASASALLPPLTSYGTSAESRNPPLACTGFVEYQTDYFFLMYTVALDHPEANGVLVQVSLPGVDAASILLSLSPEEYTALGAFYADISNQLLLLDPPDFAHDWHDMQIAVFDLVGLVYSDASTLGMDGSSITHAAETSTLYAESMNLLLGENPCPDFLPWAITQSPFGPAGTTARSSSYEGHILSAN